ncbi:uncharacterized protein [Epargyreus clarus]|uniref:uncharacterized protein n=1 Tax=Epargyreus clarus TaxID=520877 RepID=UPI003C2F27E9
MSTLYLANKLVNVTLNRVEFEKTKWLRTRYIDEKLKAVKTLRYILNKQVKNKTCRLCLKPGDRKIFDGIHEFDLVNNVKNILGIELTKDDCKPQHICNSCEDIVTAAAELKITAETTQWRLNQEFEMVADSTFDNYAVDSEKRHGGYFSVNGRDIVREWLCGKCKRTFQNIEEFTEHEQLPTCRARSRSFICETCGAEFKTMPRLKRHRQIHTGELQYSCSQCPYRARTRCALLIHERRHSGSKPLRCPYCPATFASPSNLGSHRKTHLPPTFRCDTCQRGFKFKVNLMNHIATQHRSAKPYNCNTCGKSFATRKLIRHHELKTHNRPKMRTGQLPVYMQLQQNMT